MVTSIVLGFELRGYRRTGGGLLHDGVEAVGQYALADGFGVGAFGEGADLDVEEVVGLAVGGYAVALFLEGGEEDVGDVLAGDGGYLDYEG
jgi:hypothetical protein